MFIIFISWKDPKDCMSRKLIHSKVFYAVVGMMKQAM